MIRWNGRARVSRRLATFLFYVLIFAVASAPEVRAQTLGIETSSLPSGVVDIEYSFTMTGTGGQPPYIWSASGLPSLLSMNSSTGQITGIPTLQGNYPVTITLKDSAQTTQNKNFTLVIILSLSVATVSLPSGNVDKSYVVNLTARGGTPPYSWSLASGSSPLPAGLVLSTTGKISGTPSAAGIFQFTVQVTDNATQPSSISKSLSITIVGPPLSITTTSPLPVGTVASSYSQNLAASGGNPPYVWMVSSGSLPAGLALSPVGIISGTPTTAGTANFTIRTADSLSQAATKSFALTINPAPLSITTTSPLPAGTVGSTYSQTLTATSGTPPYRWSVASGTLPAGLSLSSNGIISGEPSTAGTSDFTVQASDSTPQTATKELSITINAPPLAITTQSPLADGTVATPYSQNFAAGGGTPPYTWSVSTGVLPGGVTLSQTGTLSGTPSNPGTFSFVVQLTDSRGATTSKAFSLTVQTSLTITTPSPLPIALVNSSYSVQIQASTSDPLTWSIISGSPPAGIALSSGGLLSGTPTSLGGFDFTVQARRTTPTQTATKQFRLEVVSGFASLSLTNVPSTIDPAQQVAIGMSISPPQPNAVTGSLTISFTSNSVVSGDDPFVLFSNGSRTADFMIPANGTSAVFTPAVSLMAGTVSGTVAFRGDIRSGPSGLQVGSVAIRATVPRLTNTTAARTSGGIRIQVTGFSPDRTVINAQFGFDVRTSLGTQRVGLSRGVQSEFDAWFRSAGSAQFGSSFVFEQTFTVRGDASMIDTVTVGLTNGQGTGSSTAVRVTD